MAKSEILVVEDESICAAFIVNSLDSEEYLIKVAVDAASALQILQQEPERFNAILLDRNLPDGDGLDFLKTIKSQAVFRDIPVILETSYSDDESIRQGLNAGAYYYLIKPLQNDLLRNIIATAVDEYLESRSLKAEVQQYSQYFYKHMMSAVFHFQSIEDARSLAKILSQTTPDPSRVIMGLQELLINAVEHGNLGISYADKTRLLNENSWLEEIETRSNLPDYKQRKVEVKFERQSDRVLFTVSDEGSGFDCRKYMEFDPERAFDPHGRGIALAKLSSFDTLEYLGKGNVVEAGVYIK